MTSPVVSGGMGGEVSLESDVEEVLLFMEESLLLARTSSRVTLCVAVSILETYFFDTVFEM